MKLLRSFLFLAAALSGAAMLSAQTAQPKPRTSPHDTISLRVDDNRVTVVYGRPYTKDPKTGQPRQIWGALVPYGKVWRLGADEATLLVTQHDLVLGGTTVPAGAYTLYLLPSESGATLLIISRKIGQWGSDPYDATPELARVELKKDGLATPVDQFTMALEKGASGGGVLKLLWANTQFSLPYSVKK